MPLPGFRLAKRYSFSLVERAFSFSPNQQLALRYTLAGKSILDVCQHNANAASGVGRSDLVRIWELVALIVSGTTHAEPHYPRTFWQHQNLTARSRYPAHREL